MPNQNHPGEDDPFANFFTAAEESPSYWLKLAKLEFTEEVLARMSELALTKSELAVKLDVKPSMVTRIVNGQNNFELATMVKIAWALGCEFRSHLQRPGMQTGWMNFMIEEPADDQDEEIDWESESYQSFELIEAIT